MVIQSACKLNCAAIAVAWDGRLIFYLKNRVSRPQVHGLVLALFRARAHFDARTSKYVKEEYELSSRKAKTTIGTRNVSFPR